MIRINIENNSNISINIKGYIQFANKFAINKVPYWEL